MELAPHVEALRRELKSLTRFASEDVASAAGVLAEALEAPVRLALLDVLSTAAAEITARLDGVVVDLRLSGGEPEFVVTALPAADEPPAGPQPRVQDATGDESGTVRITLRLSESLKARVDAAAEAASQSVNSWLAHAAIRSLDPYVHVGGKASSFGQRISGYARS